MLANNDVQNVQYSIKASGYYNNGSISTSNSTTVRLPSYLLIESRGDQRKGIYLYTNSSQVTVTGMNKDSKGNGSFLAFPTIKRCDVSDYVYYGITGYSGNGSYNNVIVIVGTENSTKLELRVTQNVRVKISSTQLLTSGKQSNFKIDRLQTVYIGSSHDLTGTKIITDKPVSVFSGHECGYGPYGSYYNGCDYFVEQIPPTIYWGKEYYITPLLGTYTIKVLAARQHTAVEQYCESGNTFHLLNAGKYFTHTEHRYNNCAIVSNKEVLVAVLDYGYDYSPLMTLIPATVNYGDKFVLHTNYEGYYSSSMINIIVLAQFYQPDKMFLIYGGTNTSLIFKPWNILTVNNTIKAYTLKEYMYTDKVEIVHTNTMVKPLFMCMVYGYNGDAAFGHPGGFNILKNFPGTKCISVIIYLHMCIYVSILCPVQNLQYMLPSLRKPVLLPMSADSIFHHEQNGT